MNDLSTSALLAQRLHLIPGDDFSEWTVAALLGIDRGSAAVRDAVVDLVRVQRLLIVDDVEHGTWRLPKINAFRLRRITPRTSTTARTEAELEAQRRVEVYLVAHAAEVSELIDPGKHRYTTPSEPTASFPAVAEALRWIQGERHTLLAAQQAAHLRQDWTTTWQLAEVCWSGFRTLRRYEDLLALQRLGAEAGERDGHPVAGGCRSRVAWALNHLGRYHESLSEAQRALELATRHDHLWSITTAKTALSHAHLSLGDHRAAEDHALAALPWTRGGGWSARTVATRRPTPRSRCASGTSAESA
nr:hypothetical protein GCM10017745_50780 [Saccharothrix mutabilis subsp. capreolus]